MTSKKKMALIGALVLVMAVSAVAGTLAYLTDTASLDNNFLVGAFTPPTDPKPDPTPPGPDPANPDPTPKVEDMGTPTTYIYEPYWNANSKDTYNTTSDGTAPGDKHRLLAGDTTVKDPYIGIGKDSESGYVLACITNPMKPHVYFTPCAGWAPVDGYVTEVNIDETTSGNGKPATVTDVNAKFYSEGLFMWVGKDNGNDNTQNLAAIAPGSKTEGSETVKTDGWTDNPVFTYVYTAKNGMDTISALPKDSQKMTVSAFIHQTRGKANDTATGDTPADKDTVLTAAKSWAEGLGITPPAPVGP